MKVKGNIAKAKVTSSETSDVNVVLSQNSTNNVSMSSTLQHRVTFTSAHFGRFLQTMGHVGTTASSAGVASGNDLHVNTVGISLSSPLYNLHNYWILDTGATNHMTNRDDWLVDKKYMSETKVQLPNGGYSTVSSVGIYFFSLIRNCRMSFMCQIFNIIFFQFLNLQMI